MSEQTVIALDRAGDGILETPDSARKTVPLALPGDRVRLGEDLCEIRPLSRERVAPGCAVFGRCGGCRMLHAADPLYAAWKHDLVAEAFAVAGLAPPLAPMARSPLASRRRMTLSASNKGGAMRVGYFARASHDIVDIDTCPALDPALAAALPALRQIAADAAARSAGEARLVATLCDNGIDAALTIPRPQRGRRTARRGKGKPPRRAPPTLPDPAIIRLSEGEEMLLQHEVPTVSFGGVPVAFPAGAFVQATRAGEAALTEAMLAGVGSATRVLDAFCGLGTFALPLTRGAEVVAVDVDGPAIAALEAAARRATGRRPLRAERRDLLRHPLSPRELERFDAVVFDPPRAGARGLAEALAATASVPTVVAVSCEPRTLARDCAILVAGGYEITRVLPVDQFVASAHVECVAWLRRAPA
ncbi:MAG: class I SAM-dependent RNA methyltransferase [Acuticoccus sp.]